MHNLRPNIHHFRDLRKRAEILNILRQTDIVDLRRRQALFERLCLEMIANELEILLLCWRELEAKKG